MEPEESVYTELDGTAAGLAAYLLTLPADTTLYFSGGGMGLGSNGRQAWYYPARSEVSVL